MARGRLKTWSVLLTAPDGVRETSGRRVPSDIGVFFLWGSASTAEPDCLRSLESLWILV
jgi:hypothetical protein